MMINCGSMTPISGLNSIRCPKLPVQLQRFKDTGFNSSRRVLFVSHKFSGLDVGHSSHLQNNQIKCAVSSGRNHQDLRYQDEYRSEPFWLTLIKEVIWGFRSLIVFLVEQPGQLKYIEWPSFQSTVKTATLTLVLVALLIVALSSIDSILCFLLTLVLRKSA